MSSLPDGWVKVALGDVCGSPDQRVPTDKENFTYIDIASVDRDRKVISEPQLLLGADAPSRARKIVNQGDVIVSMTRPNLNSVALIPETYNECIASTGFDVLKPAGVDPNWIFAVVRSARFVDAMCSKVQGALYPAVKSADIRTYEFPLPPAAEQTRIAAKLDELLAQVDTLKARIDGIPGLLKRFRQTVQESAVSGMLMRGFVDAGHVSFEDSSVKELVSEPLRNGKSVKDGIGSKVLRLSALKSGIIDIRESKLGDWSGINVAPYLVRSGDFLVSRGNGSKDLVGRGGVVGSIREEIAFPDTMIRIRPDPSIMQLQYFAIAWHSRSVRAQIESIAKTTAGIWKISQADLGEIRLPVPTPEEQTEIVRRVEQLFAFADQLEARVAAAQERIDKLTQSILAKAFRGELVPQDPNDEPASVLLERIKAQRAAAPKAKRGRKAKA